MNNTIFDVQSDVSVVLTSCNRLDLLKQTLDSFFTHNTYPLKQFIIIDDSGKINAKDIQACAPEQYRQYLTIIINQKPLRQLKSIDKAYKKIEAKYVFHCEDDWLFYRPGFIEESKKILENNCNILSVWLRDYHHDLLDFTKGKIYLGQRQSIECIYYYRLYSKNGNNQCFSFNPGLLCYSHYPKNGYGSYLPNDKVNEHTLSGVYETKGLYSVLLENSVVKHIGFGKSLGPRSKRVRKRNTITLLIILLIVFLLGFWLG